MGAENTKVSKMKLTADGMQNLIIFGIFILVCIVGIVLNPALFLTRTNMLNILVSSSSVIIVGTAVTFCIITGNLNLSVGGVGAMGAVLFGLMAKSGLPIGVAALLAILLGALSGCLCGYIVAKFNLPAFIISLSFKYICRGIALIGAGGAVVFGLPMGIEKLGSTINGIPLPVVYSILAVLVFIWIQNKTVFSKQTYAVGANLEAAKLSGINHVKIITIVFAITGALAAFAGVLVTSRFSAADSGILGTLESDCIIAAVLGGTDINGGRGTIFGMFIGALFITVLANIMNMQDMTSYTQNVVKGVVLILAILLNNIIRKKVRI